jgi:thiol-disulfide isomerase/thioredoxin
MIDLSKALDFDGYLNKNNEEERQNLVEAYEKTVLSNKIVDAVKALDKEVNIVVFSEGYCPDCIVTLPFVKRMQNLNENLKVYYLGMKGNKELLEEYTGTSRIPTVMTFTKDMEPKGVYIEVPKVIAEKMAKMPSDKQRELVLEYREGKYNELIEEELLEIIK